MTQKSRILLILVVAICLLTDVWAVTRFVIHRPSRAVVVESRPGEATVKFEKMPLGAVDGTVLGTIAIVNVVVVLLVRRARTRLGAKHNPA